MFQSSRAMRPHYRHRLATTTTSTLRHSNSSAIARSGPAPPHSSSAERPAKHPRYGPQNTPRLFKSRLPLHAGRVPVIAGAGSNSTAHAIELTRDAELAGADAILSVVPYYNKPTQAGLYEHFRAITQSSGLPVILYDVPSRTVCGLADETIGRLAEMPGIIGLKDATGDVTRPTRLRSLLGPDFRLLTGDDATALAFIAQGGNGCISVTSNLVPGLCRNMFLACRQGQITSAQQWAAPIGKLTAVLFRETSPAPLKYALSLLRLMSAKVRLPLVEVTNATKAELTTAMALVCDRYSEYMLGKICGFARSSRRALAG